MQGSIDASGGEGPSGLMTSVEVARIFRVDPKTVNRWARSGKLRAVTTPSGRRLYRAEQIAELLREDENAARSGGG
jgi:predicted site-specific integrase-resolvase